MAVVNLKDLLERTMDEETVLLLRGLGAAATEEGTTAYVVGGVVRDALLGIDSGDLDIVVEEDGEEFARHVARRLDGRMKAHSRFGTAILVLPGGRKVDVASARDESYERPGALPTVRPGSLEQDLRRRDFTINAMAVRIAPDDFGELIDPYGGRRDLDAGILRVLTEASFVDDPTRTLRGVRFAARFGFSFESRSEELLREAVRGNFLSTISGERIMNEIVLILSERAPWPAVEKLLNCGILRAIDERWKPGADLGATFARLEKRILDESLRAELGGEGRWKALFLAMIEPLAPEQREAILERLRAGRALRELNRGLSVFESTRRSALEGGEDLKRSTIYMALAGIPTEVLALYLAKEPGSVLAGRVELYLSELRHVRTTLGGRELADLGVGEGRAVGLILCRLLEARLDGSVSTDGEELALARRLAENLDALDKS